MIGTFILRLDVKTSKVILQISFSLLLLQILRVCVPCDSLIDDLPRIRSLDGQDKAICEPNKNSQNDCSLQNKHAYSESHLRVDSLIEELIVCKTNSLQNDHQKLEKQAN